MEPGKAVADSSCAIRIDRSTDVPLQRQIVDAVRAGVSEGRLAPGLRLPATRVLARELGVARNTVLHAFEQLAALGIVETSRGGTHIAAARTRKPPLRVAPMRDVALAPLVADVTSGRPGPFRLGVPAIDLFPQRAWMRCVARTLASPAAELLAYDDPLGYEPLRRQIAAHLALTRGVRCDESQVIVVAGAQQAIDLAARVLLGRGDRFWFENPGYPGARAALSASGATAVPVPVDAEGLTIAGDDADVRAVYVTPSHQYPLGVTMSLARRAALLRWARAHRAWILEDDYDCEFRFDGAALLVLQSLDEDGRVVYIGTFTKALVPALRIGYVVAPRALVPAFATARAISGRGVPPLDQAALADFMEEGHFARHLAHVRGVYRARRDALVEALRAIPFITRIEGTQSGMHVVAWLDSRVDAKRIAARAADAGIEAPALVTFGLDANALVLGYGSTNEEAIRAAAPRLKAAPGEAG